MNLTAHDIIIRPIITEKSSSLMAMNKYTFEVHKTANKIQIAKAVEEVFNVKVAGVNTINVKGKTKRRGRTVGKTNSYKKAIVKLAAGETIEFFSA